MPPPSAATWRLRVRLPEASAGLALAWLDSPDLLGCEERALDDGRVELCADFAQRPDPDGEALAGLRALAGAELSPLQRVAAEDWEALWRRGLEPRAVGGLWIRPSWCASRGTPEVVIDPEQAFGSGEHASTRLALALLAETLRPGERVLDFGSGSGILGLAALRLGAGRAVGVEIDPVACRNAAGNRDRNDLPLEVVCGSLDALAPAARFDVVVANMLWVHLGPSLARLRAYSQRALIVSGQLASETAALDALREDPDWRVVAERSETQSGDLWCARLLVHARARQSSSTSRSVSSKS